MSTTAKINRLVRQALPKGVPAKIIWRFAGFSNSSTLRVVTPAWKKLPRDKRVSRLQKAIESDLTAKERAQIFRISVLTPAEFRRLARIVPREYLLGNGSTNGR
jgi:hypothetical protein